MYIYKRYSTIQLVVFLLYSTILLLGLNRIGRI